MLRKNIITCLSLAIISMSVACNGGDDKAKEKDSKEVAEDVNEQKFTKDSSESNAQLLVDVAAANYHEIEMATIAKEKSKDNDIRTLSDMLIADHNKVLAEVKDMASKKSVTLPVAESDDSKKASQEFRDKKAADFNKDWVKAMTDAHEKSISKFESIVNDSKADGEMKTWAGNTLPALRAHLDKLTQLKAKFKE
ncbi:DUF4142 domain-containing protein [Filimonas effusa]|uniref:DUF4142 domain-containing protein n=1 Tax=Filimonas effusa TaxID=2508721 RepID=A0A4Q1DAR3_9BACT|nr:DUF4142 domain-containing protein [Filimonas effusa]RXK86350.1 DUF4142 domain-containing protein [Filimonas effusa]